MKNKKQYEDVFCGKRAKNKCNFELVAPFGGLSKDPAEFDGTLYLKRWKETTRSFENSFFDHLVKMEWLTRKFTYKGERRKSFRSNGFQLDSSYGTYLHFYVGFENRYWYHRHSMAAKIRSYMDDLFPNFEGGNPFKEKYEFPFKYVTLGFLYLVKALPERMEILRYAEKMKMTYVQFLDYVVDLCSKHNEHDESVKYEFKFLHPESPMIKIKKCI